MILKPIRVPPQHSRAVAAAIRAEGLACGPGYPNGLSFCRRRPYICFVGLTDYGDKLPVQ